MASNTFRPRRKDENLHDQAAGVERVQEISEADAVACGSQCAGWPASITDRGAFGKWWMKRYGPDAWNANGFVWACEIERNQPEGMR